MNTNYQKIQKILFEDDGKTAEELEAETIEKLKIKREHDKWYNLFGSIYGGLKGMQYNIGAGNRILGGAIGAAAGFGISILIAKVVHMLERLSYDACRKKYGSTGDQYNECKRKAIDLVVAKLRSEKTRCETDKCKIAIDKEIIRLEELQDTYPI